VEAATLGAVFLLAALGPAFVAGADAVGSVTDKTSYTIIFGFIGAAGIGAVLQLAGRALWEFGWPYVPGSIRERWFHALAQPVMESEAARTERESSHLTAQPAGLAARADDFRVEIAEGRLPQTISLVWVDGRQWTIPLRDVVATELHFYGKAPDAIIQWTRRRYERFITAISVAVAISLGIIVGLFIQAGADWRVTAALDVLLIAIVVATIGWASEVRRHAQRMEELWFARNAYEKTLDATPTYIAFKRADRETAWPMAVDVDMKTAIAALDDEVARSGAGGAMSEARR
jgi:hypothetical protein